MRHPHNGIHYQMWLQAKEFHPDKHAMAAPEEKVIVYPDLNPGTFLAITGENGVQDEGDRRCSLLSLRPRQVSCLFQWNIPKKTSIFRRKEYDRKLERMLRREETDFDVSISRCSFLCTIAFLFVTPIIPIIIIVFKIGLHVGINFLPTFSLVSWLCYIAMLSFLSPSVIRKLMPNPISLLGVWIDFRWTEGC